MPRPEKVAVVEATKEAAEKAKCIVLADFTGITVEKETELRRKLRENSVDYRVVKNRLAKISFQEVGCKELIDHLTGPTAIAFGYEDPGAPLRIILNESKKTKIPKIKAILFEGQYFPGEKATVLTSLPSRDELVAKVVGGLNAPVYNLVGSLSGIIRKLVYALDAIQKQKEE